MVISYLFILCCICISTYADNCGINFYGTSYVGLSAENATDAFSSEYSQHTFQIWAYPSRFVPHEQSILQTGVIGSASVGGLAWAVEFKLKVTIWQQGHTKPSSSVLYVDIWTSSAAGHTVWIKTRYYVILGEENYPWVHITFTTPSDIGSGSANLLINGKNRRLDKYSPVILTDVQPRINFAIGDQFHGAIDEVRIWKGLPPPVDMHSPLCADNINADAVLYIPFDECDGDLFVGYTQNSSVCAMMYGAYGDTTLEVNGADDASIHQFNPIWTNDSPATPRSCTLDDVGQCANATRIAAPVINTSDEYEEEEGAQHPSWIIELRDKALYLPVAVLLLAFIVYTLKNKQLEQQQQQLTDTLC
jgi:hypothetical protein